MAPSGYLATDNEDVASFIDMYIDGDLFTLTTDNVVKHYGRRIHGTSRSQTPPDDADLRPGHDYRFIDGTGTEARAAVRLRRASGAGSWCSTRPTGEYRGAVARPRAASPWMADCAGIYVYQPARQGLQAGGRVGDGVRRLLGAAQDAPSTRRMPRLDPAPLQRRRVARAHPA